MTITSSEIADIMGAVAAVNLGSDYRGGECRLQRGLAPHDFALMRAGGSPVINVIPVSGWTDAAIAIVRVYPDRRYAALIVSGTEYSRHSW